MKLRLVSAALFLLGLAGCSDSATVESPFSGTGASEIDGLLAVGHFPATSLDVEWMPLALKNSVPAGATVTFLWLDAATYGGSAAILLAGVDPDEAVMSLSLGGLLRPSGKDGEYVLDLERLFPDGTPGLQAVWIGNMLSGKPGGGRILLKRYDRGESLVLVPTVDLRDWVMELSDRIATEWTPSASFAISLDGRSVSKFVREQMQPMFGAMSLIEGIRARQKGLAETLNWAVFSGRTLLEALDQTEGLVLTTEQREGTRITARLTAQAGSPLSICLGALQPLSGELPVAAQMEGRTGIEVGLNPRALADGLSLLAAPLLAEMPPEHIASFEADLARARTSSSRMLCGYAGPGESNGRVAIAVGPDFRQEEIPEALEPEKWALWKDWVFLGDPIEELAPWVGESGCAARIWADSSDPRLKLRATVFPKNDGWLVQIDMDRSQ